MSEQDNPILGKVEISGEKGMTIKIVEKSEILVHDTVLIFNKKDHSIDAVQGAYEVIKKEGDLLILKDTEELGDPKIRNALAKALVKMNKEAIMEQSVIVAEQALARKSVSRLKSFFKQKQKGHKLEMKSQRGCILLKIGDEDCIL